MLLRKPRANGSSRHSRVLGAIGMVVLLSFGHTGYGGDKAMTIRKAQPQLFLDDQLISRTDNVTRVWHRLCKHPANPLITRSGPEKQLYLFGTVLREPEPGGSAETVFRMWYFAVGQGKTWVAYARSGDGIKWEKPNLNLIEIGSNKANNAVFCPEGWEMGGFSVIRVPENYAPDSERYKLIAMAQADGVGKRYLLAVSPDGFSWKLVGTLNPDPPCKPDRSCLVWDPLRNHYAFFSRARYNPPELVKRGGPAYWGRAIALLTSTDFRNWSKPQMVMHATPDDPDGTEIYGWSAFVYGGQWIALTQIHRSLPELAYIDIAISHSRDGINWTREKKLVLPRGKVGEWDRFNQCASVNPLQIGDQIWVYYSGRLCRHGEYRRYEDYKPDLPRTDTGPDFVGIGLATLRLDGWCSLQADFSSGVVETTDVILPPGDLYVNAKADWGQIIVEVLGEDGQLLSGMRSHTISADGVRLKVTWPKGKSIGDLAGKTVRLRFSLKNALLYSWKID